MSTRRARIKAIASLPVRKRPPVANPDESNQCSADGISDDTNGISAAGEHTSNSPISRQLISKNCLLPDASRDDNIISSEDKRSDSVNDVAVDVEQAKKAPEVVQRRRTVKPTINIPNSSRKRKVIGDNAAINSSNQKNINAEGEENKSVCEIHKTDAISIAAVENTSPNLVNHSRTIEIYEKTPVVTDNASNLNKNNDSSEKVAPDVKIDGITPLVQTDKRVTSEGLNDDATALHNECSFDPIIPLPSVNKNRPKLKPMPRFALRRNSLQGSASESEDDARRVKREDAIVSNAIRPSPVQAIQASTPHQARVRHDSVCSATGDSSVPVIARQKSSRIWRTSGVGEVARRAAARRRALHKPPHNALTMYDLIFYNPPNNCINHIVDGNKKGIKPEMSCVKTDELSKDVEHVDEADQNIEKEEAMPVPQVKLGPNGEIVIDEQSLVIETSEAVRSRQRISTWSVVHDSETGSGGLYARSRRSRDWNHSETLRFFRALNTLGTDFSLMLKLFPGRTRRDLKVKEKQNSALVERALMNPLTFNIDKLERQLERELEAVKLKEETESKLKLQKKNEPRPNYRKSSVASRSILVADDKEHSIPEKKMKRVRVPGALRSKPDNLKTNVSTEIRSKLVQTVNARKNTTVESPKDGNPFGSPSRFLPQNVESGSMVILSSEVPGKPNQKVLQAYIVDIVDGVTKMKEISLRPDILQSIASKMNVIDVNKQIDSTRIASNSPALKSDSDNLSFDSTNRTNRLNSLTGCEESPEYNMGRSPLNDNSRNINYNSTFHNTPASNT